MSFFITLEGIEGSGKTTQITLLKKWLTERTGSEPIVTREPGGCPIADQIRQTLLDSANTAMNERAELLLYAAARAQHIAEIIRPALERGQIVLCDRFIDATIAYQGFGRGLGLDLIKELNLLATDGITPDLTLLLDFDPEAGISRARARNAKHSGPDEDRFEQEELAFHKRVRTGYLSLAGEQKRFVIINADGSPEEVALRIQHIVNEFLTRKQAV